MRRQIIWSEGLADYPGKEVGESFSPRKKNMEIREPGAPSFCAVCKRVGDHNLIIDGKEVARRHKVGEGFSPRKRIWKSGRL